MNAHGNAICSLNSQDAYCIRTLLYLYEYMQDGTLGYTEQMAIIELMDQHVILPLHKTVPILVHIINRYIPDIDPTGTSPGTNMPYERAQAAIILYEYSMRHMQSILQWREYGAKQAVKRRIRIKVQNAAKTVSLKRHPDCTRILPVYHSSSTLNLHHQHLFFPHKQPSIFKITAPELPFLFLVEILARMANQPSSHGYWNIEAMRYSLPSSSPHEANQ
ncbi:uncharacterized protein TRIVIDRAFT_66190 [Trichoderma virens Gv29-8]|uniref:Uncharacterized protein n=1 Tax=Hypocrea virens (strain Gv29-8 / FGSC 10586) TaxID=413071 RepID=G9N8D5_HYPVG|nr:uncharacterized protein TRIVIDRAFT_66190 [Trichoderma virens Gv29-8]EHK17243.1 hypothetical protein TRIVIDRAFT_66190 [Trichoderma virens Gv29-8]